MASTHQAPRVDAAVRLRDGRTLAYAEWGEGAGRPMVLFHGGGSSRSDVSGRGRDASRRRSAHHH